MEIQRLICLGRTRGCEMNHLLPQVWSLQRNHAHIDCVRDKRLVVHELVRGEGGHGIKEKLSSLFEVPDGNAVQPLIHLQTVPPVPVSALFDQTAEGELNVQCLERFTEQQQER